MVHIETKKTEMSSISLKEVSLSAKDLKSMGSGSDNNSPLPIFKINQKGHIIYSNKASFPVLKIWNCYANNAIPQEILSKFPSLTDLDADGTIEIDTDTQTYFFSVVGFQPAEYIGVYGFKTEMRMNIESKTKNQNILTI
ncbi:MAG TPA: hypothetical protein PKM97_06325 [Bacteroidia bacterium]|nr:hypothetical protein [Bacteroidia bacterium]